MQKLAIFLFACLLAACATTPTATTHIPGGSDDSFTIQHGLCIRRSRSPPITPARAATSLRRSPGPVLPTATASFALIMDDPDAPSGTFVHWVIFNIPAISHGLPEAVTQRRPPSLKASCRAAMAAGQPGYTRSLSSCRHASLLLQTVCAGYKPRSYLRRERGPTAQRPCRDTSSPRAS